MTAKDQSTAPRRRISVRRGAEDASPQKRSSEAKPRTRIQLDLGNSALDTIQSIREATNEENTRVIIERALRLYEWYARNHKGRGTMIQIISPDGAAGPPSELIF